MTIAFVNYLPKIGFWDFIMARIIEVASSGEKLSFWTLPCISFGPWAFLHHLPPIRDNGSYKTGQWHCPNSLILQNTSPIGCAISVQVTKFQDIHLIVAVISTFPSWRMHTRVDGANITGNCQCLRHGFWV